MKFLKLDLTSPQKLKLRKGLKIRINKKNMSGKGIGLLVEPDKFDTILKTFDSDRGMMFKLSPDEIDVNENPEMIEDEEVSDEIMGNGLFKKAKKFGRSKVGKQASRIIKKKAIDTLEGMGAHMEGEGIKKTLKKFGRSKAGKQASRVIKKKAIDALEGMGAHKDEDIEGEGYHGEGNIFKKIKKGAKKAGKQTGRTISKASKQTGRTISKASKQVGRKIRGIDKKDIENALKKAGKFYGENIKDTQLGEDLREAVKVGATTAILAGITAISANPTTAPLGPPLLFVFENYGDEGLDYAIKKVGLGLRGDGLRAGSGLRAGGGLRARGDGLRAGAGVELQDRSTIPNFLLKKQKGLNIPISKISKETEGSGVHIMGNGQIFGNIAPPSARLPKPRKTVRVSNLNKSV
tara:strand:- start:11354 stop:12574 length:1221 start_codon:yes stop_codon:yes gene_type:complete